MSRTAAEEDRQADALWWRRVYSSYLRPWFPVDKHAAILDVACGDGNLLGVFQSAGYDNLRGVDISPAQIERAKKIIPQAEVFEAVACLKSMPATLDLIVALDIIEHFGKDEALEFLDSCFSALKPGGRLVIQTPNAESPFGGGMISGDFTHETAYTTIGLRWVMEMCGFTGVESRPCGPVPSDWKRLIQSILWKAICLGLAAYNKIEGHRSSGVYTRVFLISGVKAA
jgi:2-polyprenyl-3-methyl-5-hydroxy-6-metoxy-1,4-benzoquinol methylase